MHDLDLTVLLLTVNEEANLRVLLPRLITTLLNEDLHYEVVVIDRDSTDGTRNCAERYKARVFRQIGRGYASALCEGFSVSNGDYIVTLDADLSHEPEFIVNLWRMRHGNDVVIASRYCKGGRSYAPWLRRIMSRILNVAYSRGLNIPVDDLSSGFRLYRRDVLVNRQYSAHNFEILEEIVVKMFNQKYSITELPFIYRPRMSGVSKARVFAVGWALFVTFLRLRGVSVQAARTDHE